MWKGQNRQRWRLSGLARNTVEYIADTWKEGQGEPKNKFTYLQDLQISSTLEQTFHEKLPEVTGHMSSCAEQNEEKEEEDHARLPAQVPASRVLRNPGGNTRQERMQCQAGRQRMGKTTRQKKQGEQPAF